MNPRLRDPSGYQLQHIAAVDELAWASAAKVLEQEGGVIVANAPLCPSFARALATFALRAPDEPIETAAKHFVAVDGGPLPKARGLSLRNAVIEQLTAAHSRWVQNAIENDRPLDADYFVRASLRLFPARSPDQESILKKGFRALAAAVGAFEKPLANRYPLLERDPLGDPLLAADFVGHYGNGSSCYDPHMLSDLIGHAIVSEVSDAFVAGMIRDCLLSAHFPSWRTLVSQHAALTPYFDLLEQELVLGGIMPSDGAIAHYRALVEGWKLIDLPNLYGGVEF
jgi:hypothetical protein